MSWHTDLFDTLRPYADRLRDEYTIGLSLHNGDEAKAFDCVILHLEVALETGYIDHRTMLALCAYMARRLSRHQPRLAFSQN